MTLAAWLLPLVTSCQHEQLTAQLIKATDNAKWNLKVAENHQLPMFGLFEDLQEMWAKFRITIFKGGGGPPLFFVKLDFEIAVDQQTKAHDQTFEGVPDSGCPPVPAGQPRPYLVNCGPNFAKSP